MGLILGHITSYAISSAGAKDTLITLALAALTTGIIVGTIVAVNYIAENIKP